eukprot:maker-scaffold238_size242079-snap-gene-1.23 protein:Tk10923 transcript:maker-scaffold238_size242079-snap-gene-1.23-mRNA-1 annotation:"purine catabolism regulatory family"
MLSTLILMLKHLNPAGGAPLVDTMLKGSTSLPQLYQHPGGGKASTSAKSTITTVSDVDKAICARALSGGGASVKEDPLNISLRSRASSGGSMESLDSATKRDKDMSRKLLKEAIQNKRNEIKRENDRLSSSMNTPLCKSEEVLLQDKRWMSQIKDLNHSFEKIPPIELK